MELRKLLHPPHLPLTQRRLSLQMDQRRVVRNHLSPLPVNVMSPTLTGQHNGVLFAFVCRVVGLRLGELPAEVCHGLRPGPVILLKYCANSPI